MRIDYPGIGGSLGQCIYCGGCFTHEVLFGKSVPMIGIDGFGDTSLPIHEKCRDAMQALVDSGAQWDSLPDGPLRQEYEALFAETTA